ncbi:MAG: transporter substrate-binding domain-containing protein, partial [Eggerthellaceae bacterium]|nr:transporter substrate-binding domain-containing protein [Eggerthellaceae bacterium]
GGEVAFVDAEHALDPDYAAAIGVDIDSMLISQPDTGEQALEITDALVRSGAVDVVACDLSIAKYQIAQNPGKFVQLDEPLNSEHYAVGFKLGEDEMAAKVTESLKKLYEDGTVETLINKYADYGMDINNWVLK